MDKIVIKGTSFEMCGKKLVVRTDRAFQMIDLGGSGRISIKPLKDGGVGIFTAKYADQLLLKDYPILIIEGGIEEAKLLGDFLENSELIKGGRAD